MEQPCVLKGGYFDLHWTWGVTWQGSRRHCGYYFANMLSCNLALTFCRLGCHNGEFITRAESVRRRFCLIQILRLIFNIELQCKLQSNCASLFPKLRLSDRHSTDGLHTTCPRHGHIPKSSRICDLLSLLFLTLIISSPFFVWLISMESRCHRRRKICPCPHRATPRCNQASMPRCAPLWRACLRGRSFGRVCSGQCQWCQGGGWLQWCSFWVPLRASSWTYSKQLCSCGTSTIHPIGCHWLSPLELKYWRP